ncbi:hypothetical protein DSM104299_04663 [Baekduia alba]|uniref:hypothetical protein n=1 Tax=Baekduia alba TaxID=2997333 RepID=UPI0023401B6F|nr:hypothetical protein [Baekduia alba]WCB95911.1 hypothetical protein DSM104299_04663 [Baekduia alba]
MSEPLRPETVAAESDDDAEVVDALPVPEGPGEVPAPAPTPVAGRGGLVVSAGPVAVQAAAVAVTGFAAGAATVAVVRRHRAKKARRGVTRRKDGKGFGEIRASRSFLVDIHLLNRD